MQGFATTLVRRSACLAVLVAVCGEAPVAAQAPSDVAIDSASIYILTGTPVWDSVAQACAPAPAAAQARLADLGTTGWRWRPDAALRPVAPAAHGAANHPSRMRWASTDSTRFVDLETGTTRELGAEMGGVWGFVARAVTFDGGQTLSIGCDHCLQVSTRCDVRRDGRVVHVAWGQRTGWNDEYTVIAAVPLEAEHWAILWLSGPDAAAVEWGRSLVATLQPPPN